MNSISDNTGLPADLLANSSNANVRNTDLGQKEFLKLMTTQLNNQDPLKPMESGDFLGQIAQFGTVSGIRDLQQVITDIRSSMAADRSIRASSLLERDVLVADNKGQLPTDGNLRGAVELMQSGGNISIEIMNSAGVKVDEINLGNRGAGLTDFSWDGFDQNGSRFPAGEYRLRAVADIDGSTQAIPTLISERVTGVQIAPNNGKLQLDLAGGGSTGIDAVRRID